MPFATYFDSPSSDESTDFYFLFLPLLLFLNSEESERVSELKSISGSSKLPYGTLALGAEGIKNAIKSFDDAYASSFIFTLYLREYLISDFL